MRDRSAKDSPTVTSSSRAAWYLGPWLPAIVGALCLIGTLGNDFTYDDHPIVRESQRIRDPLNFRAIWMTDWWYEQRESDPIRNPGRDRLWRPLTVQTFAINHAIHGLSTVGYHATNVVLHATTCALLWLLIRRLFADPAIASAAALLFAVHPVHVEAVAGIVGRAEVLAALLLLCGLLVICRGAAAASIARVAGSLPLFVAALLAKETAICYPALAIITMHYQSRRGGERVTLGGWLTRGAILVAPLVPYFIARFYALEQRVIRERSGSPILNPLFDADLWGRVHSMFTVLGHYARLLLAPTQFSSDYGLAVVDPNAGPSPMALVGVIAAAGLCALLLMYFRKSESQRMVGLCAALFVASYALVSNSVFLIGVSLAERLMYWPSVLVCMGLGVAVVTGYRRALQSPQAESARQWGVPLALVFLLALGARTVTRSGDWKDDRTLFAVDYANWPESVHLALCRANGLIQEVETAQTRSQQVAAAQEAARVLDRALAISAGTPAVLRMRGIAARHLGDADGAIRFLEAAVQFDPRDVMAQQHLAELRGATAADEAAIADLRRAADAKPDDAALRAKLGAQLMAIGRPDLAFPEIETASKLSPGDVDLLRTFAELAAVNHRTPDAIAALRRAVALRPDDWRVHANLSALLSESDKAATLHHAEIAVKLQPNDVRCQTNYAEALVLNDRRGEAMDRLRLIIRGLKADDPMRSAVEGRLQQLQRTP